MAPTSDEAPESEYEIPLNDRQLRDLGRFTALCSQIDFLMGEAISLLTQTPWWAMNAMLDSATTGPRLAALRKISSGITDPRLKPLCKKAVQELNGFIEKRNHVIHGFWAIQVIESQKTTKPGATFNKQTGKPILAEDLGKLVRRAAAVSRLLGELIARASPEPGDPWTEPRRIFIANAHWDTVPEWLKSPGDLQRTGYPNPGDTIPAPPSPRKPNQA